MIKKVIACLVVAYICIHVMTSRWYVQIIKKENLTFKQTKNVLDFNKFYKANPLLGKTGKKIFEILNVTRKAAEKYGTVKKIKYDPRTFLNEFEEFIRVMQEISFNEIKEFNWPEKRSEATLYKRLRLLMSFSLDFIFSKSKNSFIQSKVDNLDSYLVIEALFKFSSLVETSHNDSVLSKMVPLSVDTKCYQAIWRLYKENGFSEPVKKRFSPLIDYRQSCAAPMDEVVEREVKYVTRAFKKADKKYFLSMILIKLIHGNALEQYLSFVDDFKKGASRAQVNKRLKKANVLVQAIFTNFWKIKEKIIQQQDRIKILKTYLSMKSIKSVNNEKFDIYTASSQKHGIDSYLY